MVHFRVAENHKANSSHLTGQLFIGECYKLGMHILIERPEKTMAHAPGNNGVGSPWKYRHFRDIEQRTVDLEGQYMFN